MSRHKIFVYGTLMVGRSNHYLIADNVSQHAKLLGKARTFDKYPLIVATRFNLPFLLYKPGTGKNVIGEIYEVDDEMLQVLDKLEGHPHFYERDQIQVQDLEDGQSKEEQCYVYVMKKYKKEVLDVQREEDFLECYRNNGPKKYIPPKDRPAAVKFWHDIMIED